MLSDPNNPKQRAATLVIVLVVLALGLGLIAWLKSPQGDNNIPQPDEGEGVFCTMEAKICPDGSAVGRQAPDCQFAPCPGEEDDDNTPSITIPSFSASYIEAQQWPPAISSNPGQLSCEETPAEVSQMIRRVSKRTINGREYCITVNSEGAAGSVYSDYTYSFQDGENITNLQFILRFPECTNYSDTQRAQCQQEREEFDLNTLVDSVARSL